MKNFFKEQSNKNFTILVASLMFLLGSALVAYNFNIFNVGASHSGSASGINDVHSGASKQISRSLSGSSCSGADCRTISNTSSNPVVAVPLGTSVEWCTFLQKLPTGVSRSSCYTYPSPGYGYPSPGYGYPYPYPYPSPSCPSCGGFNPCCETYSTTCGACTSKSFGTCCQ